VGGASSSARVKSDRLHRPLARNVPCAAAGESRTHRDMARASERAGAKGARGGRASRASCIRSAGGDRARPTGGRRAASDRLPSSQTTADDN